MNHPADLFHAPTDAALGTMTDMALADKVGAFAARLTPGERDALKFRFGAASASRLDDDFDISLDAARRQQFFQLLRCTLATQAFSQRVPPYGIAYRGRPPLMTAALLRDLRDEASRFRPLARENYEQFIATIDTPLEDTLCERLAGSAPLLRLVCSHAGPCLPSFISSYIYYDCAGQCSKPHVDNAFTAVTVMIGLRHDRQGRAPASASVAYWPDLPALPYRLAPGELAVFFGSGVLHGRTPVAAGETVHSLLLSFRPARADGLPNHAGHPA